MASRIIVLALVFVGLGLVDASMYWQHPMHNVYRKRAGEPYSYNDEAQSRFLSLNEKDLRQVKRALRRVPLHNSPLSVVHDIAGRVEAGQNIEIDGAQFFPNAEERLMELWRTDYDFQLDAREYMTQVTQVDDVTLMNDDDDLEPPEDRAQTQGYEGCLADYDAYIGPLTRRWVWDTLVVNGLENNTAGQRPDGPDSKYRFILDATARRPRGLFEGTFHWVGAFEECTSTKIQHNVSVWDPIRPVLRDPESRIFQGKYTRLDMPITIPLDDNTTTSIMYFLGICVPDTCTKDDVRLYLTGDNTTHSNSILSAVLNAWNLRDVYMGQETDWDNDIPAKASFGILLAGTIIIIISSCYDGWGRHRVVAKKIKKNGLNGREDNRELTLDDIRQAKSYLYGKPGGLDTLELAFSAYSLYSNARHLFTTKPRYSHFHVPALDGIRSLSVMWIIYGMTYVYGTVYFECWTSENLISAVKEYLKYWEFMPILQMYRVHDTLFFISGFTCTFMWYRHWEKSGRSVNVKMVLTWMWSRYMSIMPAMMLMLMIYTCLTRYISDGPLQPRDVQDSVNCRKTWWLVMLLFHNVIRTDEQCFGWSWMYGAVYQLNLASMFIIIPLVIKPVIGYVMIALMYLAHIIILVIWNQRNYDGEIGWFYDILQTPWCNAGAYCIGMVMAIITYKARGRRQTMSWPLVLLLWLVAVGLIGTCVYAPWSKIKPDGQEWSRAGTVAFDSLAPQMMALGVAWIMWACNNGYGGVIGALLNWRLFTVGAKLALPMTLFMGPTMMSYIYGRVQILHIYESQMRYLYYGHLLNVVVFGLFVSLLFQMPINRSMKTQAEVKTRLEFFVYCNHPKVLDQLTGDPERDQEFWDSLEETEKENEFKLTEVGVSGGVSGIGVGYKGKPVGGFVPCQDAVTTAADISYAAPVINNKVAPTGQTNAAYDKAGDAAEPKGIHETLANGTSILDAILTDTDKVAQL